MAWFFPKGGKMKIFKVLIYILTIICISGCLELEKKQENNGKIKLGKKFEWTVGDWVAYRLSNDYSAIHRIFGFTFDSGPKISGIVRASYDRKKNAIIMEIRGAEKSPNKAKKDIKMLLDEIEETHIPQLSEEYAIILEKTDFYAIYINIEKKEEIVRWENGKYILPGN